MSDAKVTVRYDGPALANHLMDVADLAPALLGLSDLLKRANARFNGDRTAVKVLIDTDVEHRCFQVDLHIIQSVWSQTKALLGSDDVASAKNLLEWIGLIGGSIAGVLGALKYLRGRQVSETKIDVVDGKNVVQIRVAGDKNFIQVHKEAYELLLDKDALASAKRIVEPVAKDGYSTVDFDCAGKRVTIDQEEAAAIASTEMVDIKPAKVDEPQSLLAWITVHSPVYDVKAPKWRFRFGGAVEYMDISETDIASATLVRGGAMVDDAYRVRLELRQEHLPSGEISNSYKIKEVLEFKPANLPMQIDAFKRTPDKGVD